MGAIDQKTLEQLLAEFNEGLEDELDFPPEKVTLESLLKVTNILLCEVEELTKNAFAEKAILSMFDCFVEKLRFSVECNRAEGLALLTTLRNNTLAAWRSGEVPPERLMFVVNRMTTGGLEPGEELRQAVANACLAAQAVRATDVFESETSIMLRQLEKVAEEERNAYATAEMLVSSLAAFPEAQKANFAAICLRGNGQDLRDAALTWLLDPSRVVRMTAAEAALEQAKRGRISGDSLRRLMAMRDWLPQDERALVEQTIDAGLHHVEPRQSSDPTAVRGVYVSACDGSGGQSVMIEGKDGRNSVLMAAMFRRGGGIDEVWAAEAPSRWQITDMIEEAQTGMDLMSASAPFAVKAAGHYLGVSVAANKPPPFNLLRVMEAEGLGDVRPRRFTLEEMLNDLADGLPDDAVDPDKTEEWLNDSAKWSKDYMFPGSWFDDSDEMAALVRESPLSRPKLTNFLLEHRIEGRRLDWAEIVCWTGQAVREAEQAAASEAMAKTGRVRTRRLAWPSFAVVARELVAGRPLAEIPAMRGVAAMSIDVLKPPPPASRRRGGLWVN